MSVFLHVIFLFLFASGFTLERTQRCKIQEGLTDFEYLRKNNFCYIDKTGFFLKMLESKLKYYFIARPRKFGKSLFCRTVESVSWGNREFFHDLAIGRSTYDWKVHPVIYLDFSGIDVPGRADEYAKAIVDKLKKLPNEIKRQRKDKPRKRNVRIHADDGGNSNEIYLKASLRSLVGSLNKAYSSKTTIIIDEYDHALVKNLEKPEICDRLKETLQDFYSCVKSLEDELNFVFITGVTRFAQASSLTSMNNLEDLSMDKEYSHMLGFTADEIEFLAPEIEELVKYKQEELPGKNITMKSVKDELQKSYDGYRFTAEETSVYHPSFLLTYLYKNESDAVETRKTDPSYLFELLPTNLYSPGLLTGINATTRDLHRVVDPDHLELASLLFRTGIFSIKDYDPYTDTYFLHYPNEYMAEYFEDRVFESLMHPLNLKLDYRSFVDQCLEMVGNLLKGDENHVRKYFEQLNIIAMEIGYRTFPNNPSGNIQDPEEKNLTKREYHFKVESAFQLMIETCFDVTKFGQVRTFSHGHGDIEFEIPKQSKTILYETKAGVGDVRDALDQLLRLYAKAYLNKNMNLVCIPVSYSKEATLELEDWIYVEYNEKGIRQNFFSKKGRDVKKMNLYNISIS